MLTELPFPLGASLTLLYDYTFGGVHFRRGHSLKVVKYSPNRQMVYAGYTSGVEMVNKTNRNFPFGSFCDKYEAEHVRRELYLPVAYLCLTKDFNPDQKRVWSDGSTSSY